MDRAHIAKINGIIVQGRAHIQPGVNNWIGIFFVTDDLLEQEPKKWKSIIIDYEGPFNCKKECIRGRGKAKIIYTKFDPDKNLLQINVNGISKPELDEDFKQEVRFSYNENLPVYKKTIKHYTLIKLIICGKYRELINTLCGNSFVNGDWNIALQI